MRLSQYSTKSPGTEGVASASCSLRENVVGSRQAADWTIQPLPYRELKRRLWHMMPGVLAFGLLLCPHADPISPTLRLIILSCCVGIGVWIFLGFRQIQRLGEGDGIVAVAGYSLSVLLTTFLFPRDLELGLSVLAILAFGDGSATLIGCTFRGPRLPWNHGKTWSGLLGFIACGSLMASWIYWGETHNLEAADPSVSYPTALLLTSPAVVVSALAESIRSRINDNLRVGVVASVMLAWLHSLRLF